MANPAIIDPLVHLRRFGGPGPWGNSAPSGIGDLVFSNALALRFENGKLLAVTRAWNTANHVEWEIPIEWNGNQAVRVTSTNSMLIYKRNLGTMPGLGSGWYGGLFYDDKTGLYFSNRQINYDTDPAVATTSMVGIETNGKLVGKKQLRFSIGDKRCAQVCRIPEWFAADHLGGGDWYALCGGGGASAVATGNVSLAPSICAFQLPGLDGTQDVECIELQGAKWSSYITNSKRQQTENMRWQEFGDTDPPVNNGWPAQPYLTGDSGYWGWAHLIWAGVTWIDVPGISGPLFYICEPCQTEGQKESGNPGCEYYGHNDGSDNPCSGWPGNKACLNTSAKRPVFYITDWHDLAAVIRGEKLPSDVQSRRVEFSIPNIKIPAAGWPSTDRDGVGVSVAHDETRDAYIYGLMINGGERTDGTINSWPTIQLYQIAASETIPEPEPEPPPSDTTMLILDSSGTEVASVTVKSPYTFVNAATPAKS